MGIASTTISDRVIEAVMAQKLPPGARLGEQQLALLFGCSRTIVREALTELAARGIVTVSARRGWYVIEPSQAQAVEAFEARRVIELGLIRQRTRLDAAALHTLKNHLAREQQALRGHDVGTACFLLGDFHVCLAECLGNRLLANALRDLTARTTLIAMHYQSSHDAVQSCDEHHHIVAALESGDMARAEVLMDQHLFTVQKHLQWPGATDALARLRGALAPIEKNAQTPSTATPQARKLHSLVSKRGGTSAPQKPTVRSSGAGGSDDNPSTYF